MISQREVRRGYQAYALVEQQAGRAVVWKRVICRLVDDRQKRMDFVEIHRPQGIAMCERGYCRKTLFFKDRQDCPLDYGLQTVEKAGTWRRRTSLCEPAGLATLLG